MDEDFGRIRGYIQLPKELKDLINIKARSDTSDVNLRKEPERPDNYDGKNYNDESYIVEFERLIDPVLIALFYGLYKSGLLPPESETPVILEDKHEFLANISTHLSTFINLLFCLWIKENGFPDETMDILEYRKQLYNFLKRIMNQDYVQNVMIPFYLDKARISEEGQSFLNRLSISGFVPLKITDYSPEYLAQEFSTVQEDFIMKAIAPLAKK